MKNLKKMAFFNLALAVVHCCNPASNISRLPIASSNSLIRSTRFPPPSRQSRTRKIHDLTNCLMLTYSKLFLEALRWIIFQRVGIFHILHEILCSRKN